MKPRKQENNSHKSGQSVGGKGRLLVIARKDKDDVGGLLLRISRRKGLRFKLSKPKADRITSSMMSIRSCRVDPMRWYCRRTTVWDTHTF
jgi:hypothetical protein